MEYRPLGKTGLQVSSLAYGASPLGGVFGAVDEAEGIRCVHTVLDLGINLIDVSPFYGLTKAESFLGRALKGIARDRYYLSTKVGRYGGTEFDFSAARVTASVDESLARLGVDHVDLILCHDIEYGSLNQIVNETLPALREVVKIGKARFIGVSGLPLTIFQYILDRTDIDVILSYCHYTLTDSSLETLLPYLRAKGVGVMNASPLSMGLLGDAALPDWHPAPPSLREAAENAAAYCRSQGENLADLAVSWSVARPDIASTLVGSASAEQMKRNISAAGRVPDPGLLTHVRRILLPVRDLSWPSGRSENDLEYQGKGLFAMNETVLQFGAGNFLRGFVDTFLDEMNKTGQNVGRVVIVQSTGTERAAAINSQQGRFHLLVRGFENGAQVDRVQEISSISRALVATTEWDAVIGIACSPFLKAVVSNTTEAGLVLDPGDEGWPERGSAPDSFPAKLLALLRARFDAKLPGLTIFPCELIANNADVLRDLILKQAELWGWDRNEAFAAYLTGSCVWVNSLVDRIVSGKPAEHALLAEDTLLAVAEPFAFWAIEDKPGTEWLVHPAIHRAADIQPFALRKVRILNGAHTALLAHLRLTGRDDIKLVREAVADPEIYAWLRGLLFEEIVPTVADRAPNAEEFANQTLERFANPFMDHKWADIGLHHDMKVKVRLVPTQDEYRAKFGREPERLGSVLSKDEN